MTPSINRIKWLTIKFEKCEHSRLKIMYAASSSFRREGVQCVADTVGDAAIHFPPPFLSTASDTPSV